MPAGPATPAADASGAKSIVASGGATASHGAEPSDGKARGTVDSMEHGWTILLMVVAVATCYFATAFNVGFTADTYGGSANAYGDTIGAVFANAFSLNAFVTREDRASFVASSIYILYYCARMMSRAWKHHMPCCAGSGRRGKPGAAPSPRIPKPINPVLVCISLAVQRIYGSVDNPYIASITFLMLTWTLHKLSMFERSMIMYVPGIGSLPPSDAGGTTTTAATTPGQLCDSVPFRWAGIVDVTLDCVMVGTLAYDGVMSQVRKKYS